jgi:glycosyltransferase involved in cell wall biosynthesis
MASGSVPVVISKGGIPEIVNEGDTGFLWTTTNELVLKTVSLINSPDLIEKIKANSLLACQNFSKENFENHLLNLIL